VWLVELEELEVSEDPVVQRDQREHLVLMVQVQLSPQSLQQFKRYQLEQGVRESQGMAVPRYITVTCTRQEFNGNRFGRMEFSIA
jgi:hypothetical protein